MLYNKKKFLSNKYPAWIDKTKLNNGDTLTIVSDIKELDDKYNPGKKKFVAEVKDKEGTVYTCGLNKISMDNFHDAFGNDTTEWINKDATVMLGLTSQGKTMLVLRPVTI